MHPLAKVPAKSTQGSAGYDVTACEDAVVRAGSWTAVDTGVALAFSDDCYCRVAPRSGLAFKHGLDTFAGVVDSDFKLNIKIILMNHGQQDVHVAVGDRIAQFIFERIFSPKLVQTQEFCHASTHAGFGSTGL